MKFLRKLFGTGLPAVIFETSDRQRPDVSGGLTPEKINSIMQLANSGNPADQCKLAAEVLEKNHDILQAMSTRRNAVLGCPWQIDPGDDSPEARAAADKLAGQLGETGLDDELDSFDDLLADMLGALLPGFMVSEIAWRNGGEVAGFKNIPAHFFTFQDSYMPRLVTRNQPLGVELPRRRIIYHRLRLHGSDPVRGGLIRPLAWLHCFANVNTKDLLSFIERYGMPFLLIKADNETYQRERNVIKRLIRNFGSSGGGLFSHNVEAQLLQSANNTGDVYFRLLEYLEAAINKIILGQTASSGDGGGLSKDNAQDKVRQDILEADCRWLERSVDIQLFRPWTSFNFGHAVAAPKLKIDAEPPEDKKNNAEVVKIIYDAGFDFDEKEISDRFGFTVVRRAMPSPTPYDFISMSDRSPPPPPPGVHRWLEPMARDIVKVIEAGDADFDAALQELLANPRFDTEAGTDLIETGVVKGFAAGVAAAQPSGRRQ